MTRFALVLLLPLACALPGGDVLAKSMGPVPDAFATCQAALGGGAVGDACSAADTCSQKLTPCGTEKLTCESGVIVKRDTDYSDCPSCTGDETCTSGTWCTDKQCVPCPVVKCANDCPAGQKYQQRNGCMTCSCI
jgi:hypothetical protein